MKPFRLGRARGALAAAAVAFVFIAAARLGRQDAGARRVLTIGAMAPGTSWYVFAATLAQLLEDRLPPDWDAEVIARGGAISNPTLVERGRATIAISQVATAVWAWKGHAAFRGREHKRIRALAGGLNSVWITAVATEAYVARTGNDTLEKALLSDQPPRIIMKPPGSVVPIVADMIFALLGTSRAELTAKGGSIIQVSAGQIPELIRDGRADLYFESAIRGHPALTEVATLTPVRFLDLPDQVLEALSRDGLKPSLLPVWFKGQSRPTKAVDCGTVLIARDDLPDEMAYLITQTICENTETLVRAHKAWADFDPARAGRLESTGIPLHPGAERYYKERGWL